MTTLEQFKKMLLDYAPMWFDMREQIPGDPWRVKDLRCLECHCTYVDMKTAGTVGTKCPNCGDYDRDFKW